VSFAQDLDKFKKKAEKQANAGIRKLIIQLVSSVTIKTVVDTGRLRNNWFTSIDSAILSTRDSNTGGADSINNSVSLTKGVDFTKSPKKVFIVNNLPYATIQEKRNRMVKNTVDQFKSYVERSFK